MSKILSGRVGDGTPKPLAAEDDGRVKAYDPAAMDRIVGKTFYYLGLTIPTLELDGNGNYSTLISAPRGSYGDTCSITVSEAGVYYSIDGGYGLPVIASATPLKVGQTLNIGPLLSFALYFVSTAAHPGAVFVEWYRSFPLQQIIT